MGLLCPCRNCREALHRELDKLWPPSVRRRASGQKEESRALEIPGKTTAWFPKICCMCPWEMRYIFLDLYGQFFFLPLVFCCCCNLFSTLYYSRTQQKLFGSELQRRSFLSWQDDHIFKLGFPSFIIWHCQCYILGAVAWFSHIDSQEWPGNQVQSLWRRWGYAQVLQTRAIGAEEHRRKWHKQRVQADKYSQRWIAWICKAYIHAEALFFSFLCFALSHSEFISTSSTDTFFFGRDKGCFTSS